VQAIRLGASGGIWVDQRIIQLLVDQLINRYSRLEPPRLSVALEDRERNVLLGILRVLTNKEIGERMGRAESSCSGYSARLVSEHLANWCE
jgi:DNA-binding NarL/FixJ family response regulator